MADDADNRGFSMGWIPTVASLAGLAVLLALGTWQTGRYFDKKRRETLQERRLEKSPARLSSVAELDDTELNYRRVKVSGTVETDTQIVVEHRHYNGDPGSWLVQPLRFPDGGGRILVNRGWIPFEKARSELDRYTGAPSKSPLVGLLYRLPDVVADDENRQKLEEGSLEIAGQRTEWDSFDVQAIYEHLSTPTPEGPWVLVLAPEHTGERYPLASYKHVTEPFMTSTRHLSYGIFWYTVAAALIGIYIAAGFGTLRSRKRGRAKVPNRDDE